MKYKIILVTSLISFTANHIPAMQPAAIPLSPIALQFKQAIENQDLATIDALLNTGFDIETPLTPAGSNALILAAFDGHTEVVRMLLKRKANINTARQDGVTALFMAAQNGHDAIANMLLQAAADVNTSRQQNDVTALFMAIQKGHAAIVHMFLQAGADVNAKDKSGNTALMIAIHNDRIKVAVLLLLAKAHVDAQNNNGATALQFAVQANHKTVISLLRAFGARNNIPNNDRKTPLYYAQSHEIRDLLRETPEEAQSRVQSLIEEVRQELLSIKITPILRKREIGLRPTQKIIRPKNI